MRRKNGRRRKNVFQSAPSGNTDKHICKRRNRFPERNILHSGVQFPLTRRNQQTRLSPAIRRRNLSEDKSSTNKAHMRPKIFAAAACFKHEQRQYAADAVVKTQLPDKRTVCQNVHTPKTDFSDRITGFLKHRRTKFFYLTKINFFRLNSAASSTVSFRIGISSSQTRSFLLFSIIHTIL